MSRIPGWLAAMAVVGAMWLSGAPVAQAQNGYSDAKLDSFANAVVAVNAVVEKWRPQIQAATDDEQAQSMANDANAEMRAAVDGTDGITVDEYQEIAQAAQNDPELMARLDAIMGEKLSN